MNGLPVARMQAKEACLKEWLPRWRVAASLRLTRERRNRSMKDISLDQLDRVLATHPTVWDLASIASPRSETMLLVKTRSTFIDLMQGLDG